MDSLTGPTTQVRSPGNSMSSKMSSTNSSTPITMILNNGGGVNKSHSQSNLSGGGGGGGGTRSIPKASAVPVRRASSRTSIGAGEDGNGAGGDNGKVRNLRSSIWNWLKI